MIGYKPDLKSLGKRSALNAHAAFDVAGAGNMIGWIGAPVLDPTCERFGGEIPPYLLDCPIATVSWDTELSPDWFFVQMA